jgi:small nuclear ribonucleoprotein (snRNP)-like protein
MKSAFLNGFLEEKVYVKLKDRYGEPERGE